MRIGKVKAGTVMIRSSEESQYRVMRRWKGLIERKLQHIYDDVETIEEAKGLKAMWYHQPSKRGLDSPSPSACESTFFTSPYAQLS